MDKRIEAIKNERALKAVWKHLVENRIPEDWLINGMNENNIHTEPEAKLFGALLITCLIYGVDEARSMLDRAIIENFLESI